MNPLISLLQAQAKHLDLSMLVTEEEQSLHDWAEQEHEKYLDTFSN